MTDRAKAVASRVAALLLVVFVMQAQEVQKDFTDPVALLKAVAKTYAAGVDSFHLVSVADITSNAELRHEWRRVYQTAIKGPGNLYRIETRSPYGSWIQESDGTNEWVYQIENKMYVKRPLPRNWPQFSGLYFAGNQEVTLAWSMRRILEGAASGYKSAAMLPQESISLDGHSFPCYVVRVTSNDLTGGLNDSYYSYYDTTFWIDKAALVFRKQEKHASASVRDAGNNAIRFHVLEDSTTVYPVAELNLQISPDKFRFTPPVDAKEVAKLEGDWFVPKPPATPTTTLVGQTVPDVSFVGPDGGRVALSAYRGKPLLLDIWATWCGPCISWMPALHRIYMEVKNRGVAVVTVDQDVPENAVEYLARHNYSWTNYHDFDNSVGRAFKTDGIPLTILVDAQGKIVYYDFGGDEAAVRKAIAALGPEFVSIAASVAGGSDRPRH
jgi:thiol-disulfide isomerase/thioredoxin/outer membrane lipoprotein-sorting protein